MDINTPFTSAEEQAALLPYMRGALPYTLMNDFLSKYSFQKDLYALKGLLSALLRVDIDSITNITILNPIEPSDIVNDKTCILDIKLELNHTQIINLEIQNLYQAFWPERSLTYLCRIFDQLSAGATYSNIQPCIQIGILNHNLFKPDDPRYTDDFYSEYRMLNTRTHTEYSSKFEIRVLSLKQLENASAEDKNDPNGLYHWAKIFCATSWEEMLMEASTNPRMQSFVGTVKKLTAEEKIALACENRRRYSNEIATYEEMVKNAQLDAQKAIADANSEAQQAIDEANSKAQQAIDEANSRAQQAIDEANSKAQQAIDEATDKVKSAETRAESAETKVNDILEQLVSLQTRLDEQDKLIAELSKR